MSDWILQARCAGVDGRVFFPESANNYSLRAIAADRLDAPKYAEAKRICDSCPVKDECLAEAMKSRDFHGMWGGLTPRQRLRIYRQRGLRDAG